MPAGDDATVRVAVGRTGRIALEGVRELQELTGYLERDHSVEFWRPLVEELGFVLEVVEELPPASDPMPEAGLHEAGSDGLSNLEVPLLPNGKLYTKTVRKLQRLTGSKGMGRTLDYWREPVREAGYRLVVRESPTRSQQAAVKPHSAASELRSVEELLAEHVPTADDPRHLLASYEARWRPELGRASLVAELELNSQDIRTALRCIGLIWDAEYRFDRAQERVEASYPACFVVAVAGAASTMIEGGEVIDSILTESGIRERQGVGSALGRTFVSCLRALRLPTFPELDTGTAWRYVNRMLLHGGIPLDHLDEFFAVAETTRRRLGDVSRTALQAYMVERADEGRLYGATKAIERFLRHGEAYAADFLDRALELLDRVRDGDSLDDLNVGLPRHYLERAVELRSRGELPAQRPSEAAGVRAATRPEVRFDPYVLGVHLVLPSIPAAEGPQTWTVDFEGTVQRHVVQPPRAGLPTSEVEIPLPPRVAHAEVRLGTDDAISVRIVDLDNPHVLFDDSGRRIERAARLPAGPVWSVRPAAITFDTPPLTEPRIVERHDAVARWPGWVAELVDLTDADRLVLESGREYAVSKDASARLQDEDVVLAVRSDGDLDVLAAWPSIWLPGVGSDTSFRVSVTDLEDRRRSVTRDITPDPGGTTVDLSEHVSNDLAWRPVQIRARGPLGRSVRRECIVAPGLSASLTPKVRTIADEGLSPTRVELTWDTGAIPAFVIEPDESSRAVVVRDELTLVVAPPSVAIQRITVDSGSGWRSRPLALDAEDVLAHPGNLIVRLPGATYTTLHVVDSAGSVVQEFPPDLRARRDGAVRFDLSRLTDTLRSLGSVVLVVNSDLWRGRAATVRPARLADDVHLSETRGIVEFRGVQSDGVQAAIYSRFSPLGGPEVVEVPRGDSQMSVPASVLGLGPVRVLLRINDPWVPSPWPAFPAAQVNSYDLDDLAVDTGALAASHPLAPYLAGLDPLDSLHGRLGDALRLYDLAHHIRAERSGGDIRRDLEPFLLDDAEATLAAAVDADLDAHQLARLVVSTGLVCSAFPRPLQDDLIDRLWTRWPGAGVLACGRLEDDSPLTTFVRSRCGPAVDALLRGEETPILALPRLDHAEVLEMDETVLAMIRNEAGIAPKYLLDADARADDAFTLVGVMRDRKGGDLLARCARESESLVGYFLQRVLPGNVPPQLLDAVRLRFQAPGWQSIPAASLVVAIAARLCARATDTHGIFTSQVRQTLNALARATPGLLAADLVMAELALQGAER